MIILQSQITLIKTVVEIKIRLCLQCLTTFIYHESLCCKGF